MEGKQRVPRVARHQGAQLGRFGELREHNGHVIRPPGRVRVGARQQQPDLSVGDPARPRVRRVGDPAARVCQRDGGEGSNGGMGPAGGGAQPPGGGGVPHPQRVELNAGERGRGRADDLLAVLRGAADELQVLLHGMGDRDGDRQRRQEGRSGKSGEGDDGGGEREGDEEQSHGVEGEGRRSHDVSFGIVLR